MSDALTYELLLNRLAFSFVVIAFGVQIFVAIFITDFRYIVMPWTAKTEEIVEFRKVK